MTLLIPIVSIFLGFFTPLVWRCIAGVSVRVNLYGETTNNFTIPQYSMIQVICIPVIFSGLPAKIVYVFRLDKLVYLSEARSSEEPDRTSQEEVSAN